MTRYCLWSFSPRRGKWRQLSGPTAAPTLVALPECSAPTAIVSGRREADVAARHVAGGPPRAVRGNGHRFTTYELSEAMLRRQVAKEGRLRIPVVNWLITRGTIPVFEVWIANGKADLVGAGFGMRVSREIPHLGEVLAVELKLHDVATVIQQSERCKYSAHECWAAMPADRVAKMLKITLDKFRDAGVGLLSVGERSNPSGVDVIVPAHRNAPESVLHLRKRLWRRRNEWVGRLEQCVAKPDDAKGPR